MDVERRGATLDEVLPQILTELLGTPERLGHLWELAASRPRLRVAQRVPVLQGSLGLGEGDLLGVLVGALLGLGEGDLLPLRGLASPGASEALVPALSPMPLEEPAPSGRGLALGDAAMLLRR